MPMPPEASISGAGRPRSRSAEHEHASGDRTAAIRSYLRLYADVARMAQTDRVLPSSAGINVVDGGKTSCTNARPGLNFSPLDAERLGCECDDDARRRDGEVRRSCGCARNRAAPGRDPCSPARRSRPTRRRRSGILRHEMVHAEDYDEEAALEPPSASCRPKPKTVRAADAARAEATKEARTATCELRAAWLRRGLHDDVPPDTSGAHPPRPSLPSWSCKERLTPGTASCFRGQRRATPLEPMLMGRIQEYVTVTRSTPSIAPRSTRGSPPSSRSCVPCSRRVASVTRSSRRSGTGTLLPRAEGRRRRIVLSRAPPDLPTIVAGGIAPSMRL